MITRSVVIANAGSGKTYLLANRLIRWMIEERRATTTASPDRMLAVTFTRKAAGEILERVLRHLALGSLDRPGGVVCDGGARGCARALRKRRAPIGHGTLGAPRRAWSANSRAQLHHRLVPVARALWIEQRISLALHLFHSGCTCGLGLQQRVEARQNAHHIACATQAQWRAARMRENTHHPRRRPAGRRRWMPRRRQCRDRCLEHAAALR